MQKKNLFFILIVVFIGCIMGTALSMFVSLMIPDGVVKDFFILSKSFGFGQNANNWLVVGPLRFKMGLFFDVSILSILGIFISWYILRYFK
jgi:hypothetical protein